jgi:hypothetical protein
MDIIACINGQKYGENPRILQFFSRSKGHLTALFGVAWRRNSRRNPLPQKGLRDFFSLQNQIFGVQ